EPGASPTASASGLRTAFLTQPTPCGHWDLVIWALIRISGFGFYLDFGFWFSRPPYPSHAGFFAVPSNCGVVLNRSNWPVRAAWWVLSSSAATSSGLIGLNVFTASSAWSRIGRLSMPQMTTDVGRFIA